MEDLPLLPSIPGVRDDDPEDVSWALSTASAMWTRGEHADAIRWVRRAAEAASEVAADARALELAKTAAELTSMIARESNNSVPNPTSVPALRPREASQVVVPEATEARRGRPTTSPPAPHAALGSSELRAPAREVKRPLPPRMSSTSNPSVPRPVRVSGGLPAPAANAKPVAAVRRTPSSAPVPTAEILAVLEPNSMRAAADPAPTPMPETMNAAKAAPTTVPPNPDDWGAVEPDTHTNTELPPTVSRLLASEFAAPESRIPDPSEPSCQDLVMTVSAAVPTVGPSPHRNAATTEAAPAGDLNGVTASPLASLSQQPLGLSLGPPDVWIEERTRAGVHSVSWQPEELATVSATGPMGPAHTSLSVPTALPTHLPPQDPNATLAIAAELPEKRVRAPDAVAAHTSHLRFSQAVRVIVWKDANGVHVAPHGTVVSAITVDAMLVALDELADLSSWLEPTRKR
jgi:hypothetical protein